MDGLLVAIPTRGITTCALAMIGVPPTFQVPMMQFMPLLHRLILLPVKSAMMMMAEKAFTG